MGNSFLKPYVNKLVLLSGIASILLATVVLIGWAYDLHYLIQVIPTSAPMQTNTAICFLLAGGGIIALALGRKAFAALAGGAVTLLAVLTLSQYIMGFDLGIDQFFRDHYLTVKTSHPGRMAPNTALLFTLIGVTLSLSSLKSPSVVVVSVIKCIVILILSLAVISLSGYLVDIEQLYGWASYTRMAIHTSIGFIIIGLGLTLYAFSETTDNQKYTGAIWMSGLASVFVASMALAMWSEIGKQEVILIRAGLDEEGIFVKKGIEKSLKLNFLALKRMAQRLQFDESADKTRWLKDAETYLEDIAALRRVSYIQQNHEVTWTLSEPGSIVDEALLMQLLENVPEPSPQYFWIPLPNAKEVILVITLVDQNQAHSHLIGVYDARTLLVSALPESFTENNGLTISLNGEDLIENDLQSFDEKWSVKEDIEVLGGNWVITFWLKEVPLSNLPELILLFGTLLAIAVAAVAELARISQLRTRLVIEKEKEREVVLRQLQQSKQELSETVTQLEFTNKELEQFAYAASHDLKAPLHAVNSIIEWLEEDLRTHENPTVIKNLTLINTRIKRMEKLLDDLLEYSRAGKKSTTTENQVVNGSELKQEVVGLLNIPEGFRVTFSPKFEAARLQKMPLKQILINLISNSIKHHHNGTGSVEVTFADDMDHYTFKVSDDGPGISKKYQEKIFEMFLTLKPKDQVEGSGMGLAIVKKQITALGGSIRCESDEGRGCAFVFSIPKDIKN